MTHYDDCVAYLQRHAPPPPLEEARRIRERLIYDDIYTTLYHDTNIVLAGGGDDRAEVRSAIISRANYLRDGNRAPHRSNERLAIAWAHVILYDHPYPNFHHAVNEFRIESLAQHAKSDPWWSGREYREFNEWVSGEMTAQTMFLLKHGFWGAFWDGERADMRNLQRALAARADAMPRPLREQTALNRRLRELSTRNLLEIKRIARYPSLCAALARDTA